MRPRPHAILASSQEDCPRGLVVSRRNHVIYFTFFSDTSLEELVLLKCTALTPHSRNFWHLTRGTCVTEVHWLLVCECTTGYDFLVLINLCWSTSVHIQCLPTGQDADQHSTTLKRSDSNTWSRPIRDLYQKQSRQSPPCHSHRPCIYLNQVHVCHY